MRNLLILGELKNKMLFELAPDIFSEGTTTTVELILWDRYYGEKDG